MKKIIAWAKSTPERGLFFGLVVGITIAELVGALL
jgi:hypothetical protein